VVIHPNCIGNSLPSLHPSAMHLLFQSRCLSILCWILLLHRKNHTLSYELSLGNCHSSKIPLSHLLSPSPASSLQQLPTNYPYYSLNGSHMWRYIQCLETFPLEEECTSFETLSHTNQLEESLVALPNNSIMICRSSDCISWNKALMIQCNKESSNQSLKTINSMQIPTNRFFHQAFCTDRQ
jgi:hypothetical protein